MESAKKAIDMGILAGLVKQHSLTANMPRGVKAKKWKTVCDLYNKLAPSGKADVETLQAHFTKFNEKCSQTPAKKRKLIEDNRAESQETDLDESALVTSYSHVKRSSKNWTSVLNSLASTNSDLEYSPSGTNVVLW